MLPSVHCLLALLFVAGCVEASQKCVWASGVVRCFKNPNVNVGLKIMLFDRDGRGIFKKIDRDDMMSFTVTEEDGTFQVSGCASDFNWFFRDNKPDPFLRIKHSCGLVPRTLEIKLKKVFAPESQDVGLILLDNGIQILDKEQMDQILDQDDSSGPQQNTATGVFYCSKNHGKHRGIKVELVDRDGIGPFQWLDKDDLMGMSYTDANGIFEVEGCGNDPDFPLGLYENKPDPYIIFTHYCNSRRGEIIRFPEFRTFRPDTHDVGAFDLDNNLWYPNSARMLEKINKENDS
ncbi:hypothetical protein M3Y97_00003300 [Aphelenchoides bicaudatus]|nr:hypothetical protein M3Y97_00003300 [Aphelenchoides bicaudatus]